MFVTLSILEEIKIDDNPMRILHQIGLKIPGHLDSIIYLDEVINGVLTVNPKMII